MTNLARLSEMRADDIQSGRYDVRGWNVATAATGDLIGRVVEVLVDREARQVRYLDVVLKNAGAAEGRRILVPIGCARVDSAQRTVLVERLNLERVADIPVYDEGGYTRTDELTFLQLYDASLPRTPPKPPTEAQADGEANDAAAEETDFYARDEFSTDAFLDDAQRGERSGGDLEKQF